MALSEPDFKRSQSVPLDARAGARMAPAPLALR